VCFLSSILWSPLAADRDHHVFFFSYESFTHVDFGQGWYQDRCPVDSAKPRFRSEGRRSGPAPASVQALRLQMLVSYIENKPLDKATGMLKLGAAGTVQRPRMQGVLVERYALLTTSMPRVAPNRAPLNSERHNGAQLPPAKRQCKRRRCSDVVTAVV